MIVQITVVANGYRASVAFWPAENGRQLAVIRGEAARTWFDGVRSLVPGGSVRFGGGASLIYPGRVEVWWKGKGAQMNYERNFGPDGRYSERAFTGDAPTTGDMVEWKAQQNQVSRSQAGRLGAQICDYVRNGMILVEGAVERSKSRIGRGIITVWRNPANAMRRTIVLHDPTGALLDDDRIPDHCQWFLGRAESANLEEYRDIKLLRKCSSLARGYWQGRFGDPPRIGAPAANVIDAGCVVNV